ncbi:MAG: hypothetical protein Q7N50_04865 [Armatimonadota bacterium]|nr:hypothetical protein [Armatimonadota bacterium]
MAYEYEEGIAVKYVEQECTRKVEVGHATTMDTMNGIEALTRRHTMRGTLFHPVIASLAMLALIAVGSCARAQDVNREDLTLDLSGVKESQTVDPYFLILDPAAGGFRIANYGEFVNFYKLEGKVLTKAQLIEVVLADRKQNPKAALMDQGKGSELAAALDGFKVVSDPSWWVTRVFIVAMVFVVFLGIVGLVIRRRRQAKVAPAR